jgi:capsular polysaccharide export protein
MGDAIIIAMLFNNKWCRGRREGFDDEVVSPASPEQKVAKRILLLQGPVGPFFSELQTALSDAGFATRSVVFNAGDKLFAPHQNCAVFTGTKSEWETWLRFEIAQNNPDTIVLFGSSRPAHKIARGVAAFYGIEVLSLEEGYLRSGYVSCELGGNNQHSPLTAWDAKPVPLRGATADPAPASGAQPSSFATMAFWAATYYLVRDFASKPSDVHLFHRAHERILPMSWRWGIHLLRRLAARVSEFPTRRALHARSGYILIPLQVSSDSQMQAAARGWSTIRLIDAALMALRNTHAGSSDQILVFKLHPLEPGSAAIKRQILRRASDLGVARRCIRVMNSGRMGDLAKYSSGMVVINSTSAFSALHNDIPVLVLGDAVFRHEAIVTLGSSEADIATFFKLRHAKSRRSVDAFFAVIKSQSLIPGDFYVQRGRIVAIAGILGKLQQRQRLSRSKDEATA